MEYLDPKAIQAAIDGFEYFARADAVQAAFPAGGLDDPEEREPHMEKLEGDVVERLEELGDAYNALVLQDQVLEDWFRRRLGERPGDFAEAR